MENTPKILLGPIIGKVTNTTARVGIEIEYSKEISCILTAPNGQTAVCRRFPERGFLTVFKFSGLQPKTLYIVSLENSPPLNSQFRTLRNDNDEPGNLNIAIVSCNEVTKALEKAPYQDLWLDLSKRARQLDYVLHIGDQCYMDMGDESTEQTPYQLCQKKFNSVPQSQWNSLVPEVLDIMRTHYRRTWRHPPTAAVLANVPNLMTLDDHEIRDDWGWRKEDYDPNTTKCDYLFGQLARRAYYEYQRQLREDIDWNNFNNLECEYHDHILNGVGIVLLDYRGSRSWFREEKVEELQLGVKQTNWIRNLFSSQGKFKDLSSVLFISPIPLIYLSHQLTKTATIAIDDAQEHWTFKNAAELADVFDLLRIWKNAKVGREVTLVGGDVHIGCHSEIYYNNELCFKQFVTSAMNNEVPNKLEYMVVKVGLHMSGDLAGGYSFRHSEIVRKNNYGLLKVEDHFGRSYVESLLIISEQAGITAEKNPTSNWDRKKPILCCKTCNIF